jgi:hypothetical protein
MAAKATMGAMAEKVTVRTTAMAKATVRTTVAGRATVRTTAVVKVTVSPTAKARAMENPTALGSAKAGEASSSIASPRTTAEEKERTQRAQPYSTVTAEVAGSGATRNPNAHSESRSPWKSEPSLQQALSQEPRQRQ